MPENWPYKTPQKWAWAGDTMSTVLAVPLSAEVQDLRPMNWQLQLADRLAWAAQYLDQMEVEEARDILIEAFSSVNFDHLDRAENLDELIRWLMETPAIEEFIVIAADGHSHPRPPNTLVKTSPEAVELIETTTFAEWVSTVAP